MSPFQRIIVSSAFLAALIVCGRSMAQPRPGDDQALGKWVDRRVQAWQKTADERRFDQGKIGVENEQRPGSRRELGERDLYRVAGPELRFLDHDVDGVVAGVAGNHGDAFGDLAIRNDQDLCDTGVPQRTYHVPDHRPPA